MKFLETYLELDDLNIISSYFFYILDNIVIIVILQVELI